MAERESRERDIILSPNEYAYVQDTTKGDIVLYVGPTKISLSNTERLVEFKGNRFVPIRFEDSNPGIYQSIMASSSQYIILENPAKDSNLKFTKGSNSSIDLSIGKKVVIPGPATFPLWPGQEATVINGHKLREDQYLVVRVYDSVSEDDKAVIGTEKIIKGSETKFYIPTTGLEVVPDECLSYVRNAVILRDGEYCILLSPNGKRRYCYGPAIVFPEPMEEFMQKNDTSERVFNAYQLKKNMGLHVRVVKDFQANESLDQVTSGPYTAGMELFIKDREGFFFPSENLEVIEEIDSIPVADKEGLYVREINTGKITTEPGPQNYLPDPTKIEIITRKLPPDTEKLYGLTLRDINKAISIYIPPSFAVLITSNNKREVAVGPQTRLLNYDEDLETLNLSTGKPKTDEKLLHTCFLQVNGNKVSDIVKVQTSDHVELEILVSYRVSFVNKDSNDMVKWFNVNNYVSLLCEHISSIVRAAARVNPIEKFHANGTEIIRSAILGEKKSEEKRHGRFFEENNMHIYDVEVLGMKILDPDVNKLLADAQRKAIISEVEKKQEAMRLDNAQLTEVVNQGVYEAQKSTIVKEIEIEEVRSKLAETKIKSSIGLDNIERLAKSKTTAEQIDIESNANINAESKKIELEIRRLLEQVKAFKEQMSAMNPELIAVLKTVGDQHFTAEVSKSMSPLAILGGTSISEILERLLKSFPMGFNTPDGIARLLTKPPDDKNKKP